MDLVILLLRPHNSSKQTPSNPSFHILLLSQNLIPCISDGCHPASSSCLPLPFPFDHLCLPEDPLQPSSSFPSIRIIDAYCKPDASSPFLRLIPSRNTSSRCLVVDATLGAQSAHFALVALARMVCRVVVSGFADRGSRLCLR